MSASPTQWAGLLGHCECLLDHLIRPLQQRRRDRAAESLGGLVVDGQLERRGLLDGEIAGLCTFQDLVHVCCGTSKTITEGRSKPHEAAILHLILPLVHRWQAALYREGGDPGLVKKEHPVPQHKKGAGTLPSHSRKRSLQVVRPSRLQELEL